MKSKRTLAVAASALAAFASIAIITNQASASDTTSPSTIAIVSPTLAPTVPTADAQEVGSNSTDGDNVQSGDQTGVDASGTDAEVNDVANGVEGDNNQSGDQTSVDIAGATDAETID